MTSMPQEPTLPGLFSPQDSPAKTSPWRAVVAAWVRAHAQGSTGTSPDSWLTSLPPGSSSKTSLASCRRMADGTWVPSSGRWQTSGMASPGACWTLSTSESPSDAAESSLSDILEPHGEHLRKYFLSPTAAAGILRRSERRGRALPDALREALEIVASRLP